MKLILSALAVAGVMAASCGDNQNASPASEGYEDSTNMNNAGADTSTIMNSGSGMDTMNMQHTDSTVNTTGSGTGSGTVPGANGTGAGGTGTSGSSVGTGDGTGGTQGGSGNRADTIK